MLKLAREGDSSVKESRLLSVCMMTISVAVIGLAAQPKAPPSPLQLSAVSASVFLRP